MIPQNDKLVSLMKYAGYKCEYYKDVFSRNGICADKVDDFYRIPILTKQIIQEQADKFISEDYKKKQLVVERTSGSTGLPLYCYYSLEERINRSMSLWRKRLEHTPHILGKNMLSFHSGNRQQGEKIIYDDVYIDEAKKIMYINYISFDESQIYKYYNWICSFNPVFVRCQPSVFYNFISLCESKNLDLNKFRFDLIEFTGEYLSEYIYQYAAYHFPDAKIANHYGAQEFFCIAYSCNKNNLHILKDNLLVEIINADDDGYGDIVVTSYTNYAMPLLRYELGDVGRLEECKCGIDGDILVLRSGRSSDYFYINNQKYHGDLFKNAIESFNNHFFVVKQFVVTQKKEMEFEIDVTGDVHLTEHLCNLDDHIKRFLKEFIKAELDIVTRYVKRIDNDSQSGKHKVFRFLRRIENENI